VAKLDFAINELKYKIKSKKEQFEFSAFPNAKAQYELLKTRESVEDY